MKIFVGMETSGALRRRFKAHGCDVISCDLLPAKDSAVEHVQGDVFETLDWLYGQGWWPDAAIFHPDCTYLTNSAAWAFKDGPYHQRVKPGTLVGAARRAARESAVKTVFGVRALKIRKIIVENPIGHLSGKIGKPTQIVQPYQFGDDASKATCLWVWKDGGLLPQQHILPIEPACYIEPTPRANGKRYWANQTDNGQNRLSPSDDRWQQRSETFPGIATALVDYILYEESAFA